MAEAAPRECPAPMTCAHHHNEKGCMYAGPCEGPVECPHTVFDVNMICPIMDPATGACPLTDPDECEDIPADICAELIPLGTVIMPEERQKMIAELEAKIEAAWAARPKEMLEMCEVALKREEVRRGVELRPVLWHFAQLLERTLRKHDDKGGWKGLNWVVLTARLQDEVQELRKALAIAEFSPSFGGPGEVVDECADVAVYAMMIADNCGNLTGLIEEMAEAVKGK